MIGSLIVIHGDPKVGKSWLGATSPKPILLLDAESGGTEYVPLRQVEWDPHQYAPPIDDGTWDAAVVRVHSRADIDQALAHVYSGTAPFRSIVADSLTYIQTKMKKAIPQTREFAGKAMWGHLGDEMEDLVSRMRDLKVLVPQIEAIVLICGTQLSEAGQYELMLQGRAKRQVAYDADMIGYLFVAPAEDGSFRRTLLCAPRPNAQAGHKFAPSFPDLITDPNMTAILAARNPQGGH